MHERKEPRMHSQTHLQRGLHAVLPHALPTRQLVNHLLRAAHGHVVLRACGSGCETV